MFSYKRENGRNEKLMGWEGGIIAKENLHGPKLAHPKYFHSDFINSRETISSLVFNSKEPFKYFPTS